MKKYAPKDPFTSERYIERDRFGKPINKFNHVTAVNTDSVGTGVCDDGRSLPSWDKPLSKRLTF